MKDTSVYDSSTVTDMTLAQIFNSMLGRIRMNEFELISTNRNRIITSMLINHVDVQLDNYKKECDKSSEQDFKRRYRIVEMMYLLEESISAEKVADIECIDKSSVYRTLERAYDDLAVLFFGIDGAKMVEWKKMELKAKRELAKRNN